MDDDLLDAADEEPPRLDGKRGPVVHDSPHLRADVRVLPRELFPSVQRIEDAVIPQTHTEPYVDVNDVCVEFQVFAGENISSAASRTHSESGEFALHFVDGSGRQYLALSEFPAEFDGHEFHQTKHLVIFDEENRVLPRWDVVGGKIQRIQTHEQEFEDVPALERGRLKEHRRMRVPYVEVRFERSALHVAAFQRCTSATRFEKQPCKAPFCPSYANWEVYELAGDRMGTLELPPKLEDLEHMPKSVMEEAMAHVRVSAPVMFPNVAIDGALGAQTDKWGFLIRRT